MSNARVIATTTAAAIVAGVLVSLVPSDVTPAVMLGHVSESHLVELTDGGLGYSFLADAADGGVLITDVAPCARRPADGGLCVFVLGGALAPPLARYPAALLTGVSCQPVACAVWSGEDPDEDEAVHLAREKALRDGGP